MDEFEGVLREALSARAAQITAQAGDRLRALDYRPRSRPRAAGALGAGIAVAALAAGGGTYLAVGASPHGPAAATGSTVKLDGYTFQLPEGYKSAGGSCSGGGRAVGGPPPGAPSPSPGGAVSGSISGSGRARGSGSEPTLGAGPGPGPGVHACGVGAQHSSFQISLGPVDEQPPASASLIPVGRYQGHIVLDKADQRVTLYVTGLPLHQELVISATGMSENQVVHMAEQALSGAEG